MFQVGAVIVTYQTPNRLLQDCLASLRSNHIQDISVVANTKKNNPGFAAAANMGAARLSTDYLFFINPDAILKSNACLAAQNYLVSHPYVGIVGLLLSSGSGHPETRSFGAPVTPFSLFTRHLLPSRFPKRPAPVGWVSGGALMIRRTLFTELGGFDPQFFLYWEDVDLCRRAREAGWRVVLLPQAGVLHQRGGSLSDNWCRTKLYDQSADKYFRKHYPKMICLMVRSARSLYRLLSPRAV